MSETTTARAADVRSPLNREDVAATLAERLGRPASARLANEAWRSSGGVSAVLDVVIDAGAASGAIQIEDHAAQLIAPLPVPEPAEIPPVAQLTAAARAALEAISLIEPAPMALIEQLLGSPPPSELVDAGLLRAVPRQGTRPETVWIPPRAIADALRRAASAERSADVHERVLARPLPRASAEWCALGRSRSLLWWYERGIDDAPPMAPLPAVRAANRLHAWELASDLASHALERESGGELLRERAFARRFLGDTGGAHDDLSRLAHAGDAGTTIAIADLLHYEEADAEAALDLLRSTAERAASPAVRRELFGALSSHLAYAGRFGECEAAHRELPPGPVRERGRADVAHAITRSHRGRTTEALRRLYRYHFMPTPDAPLWFAEELQGALFVCLLQAHGPRRTLTATGVLGSTEASPFVRLDEVSVLTARISVLLAQGHALEALRLSLSVEASGEQDRSGFGAHAIALGAEAAAYLGDADRSRALEARFREAPDRAAGILRPNSEAALCAAALIRGDAGAAERCLAIASELAADGLTAAALRVAQAGLRVGDAACAVFAAALARDTSGEVCAVFAAHGAALRDREPHALMDTAEHYLRLGFTLHAVEAFCQASTLSEQAGVDALAAEASARARLILGLAEGIRAPHLAEAGKAPVELSLREREIALLVSQGASNRSIAQALVISVRTVEGHLGRMYAKLGVSGRRELAGYVRRGDAR